MKYTVGYTHNGFFHFDEVMGTAFLERVFPGIKIKRVSKVTDKMREDENAIIFDIGLGEFDHHQIEQGPKYCAFGKLFKAFGREYLQSLNIPYVDEVYKKFWQAVVTPMNYGDNYGYKTYDKMYCEQNIVKSLNPSWDKKETNRKIEYNCFRDAVAFADVILETRIKGIAKTVYNKQQIEEHVRKVESKLDNRIIICNSNENQDIKLKEAKKLIKIINDQDEIKMITRRNISDYFACVIIIKKMNVKEVKKSVELSEYCAAEMLKMYDIDKQQKRHRKNIKIKLKRYNDLLKEYDSVV